MSHSQHEDNGVQEEEGESSVERCKKANEAYCEACEQQGVKVCPLDELPARQDFLDGRIDEAQLQAKAATEASELAKTFGKYLVVQDQQPGAGADEAGKRERAKLANRIYKRICEEAGLSVCFFSDFSSWSEYMNGEIEDRELYGRAKAEIEKLGQRD